MVCLYRKDGKGDGSPSKRKSTSRNEGSDSENDGQEDSGEREILAPLGKAAKPKIKKLDASPSEALSHPAVSLSASSSPRDIMSMQSINVKPGQHLTPIQVYRTQGYQPQTPYPGSQAMSHTGYHNYYAGGYSHIAPTHSPNMAMSMQMPPQSAALGLHHPQMGLLAAGTQSVHPSTMNCSPYQTVLPQPMQGQMTMNDSMIGMSQMGLPMPMAHHMTDVAT